MESPGEFLKRERELRGVTIETISSELKLSPKTIKAIEDNNEADLPHSAYVKGFIRSYCHWLGLDDNDAILRYESYLRERVEIENSKKAKKFGTNKDRGERQGLRPTGKTGFHMTVVFAVVGIVIIVGYIVIYGGSRPDMVLSPEALLNKDITQVVPIESLEALPANATEISEPSAPIVVLPELSDSKELSTSALKDRPVETTPLPNEVIVAKKDLNLEIRARELTWVEVALDGDPPYDITLEEGESVSLKAAKVFF